jgi:hypothetical protein
VCCWALIVSALVFRTLWGVLMASDSSFYKGNTREIMDATEASVFFEKAVGGKGGHPSIKRRGILSRQRSSMSFDMGAKKIDQVCIAADINRLHHIT